MGISTSVKNPDTTIFKSTSIDGIAATSDRDSQGEILDLEGADISQVVPKGYWNDNHNSTMSGTLGKITFAKKIMKESDIGSPREREYWERVKRPFLYAKGYLFDGGNHANANAVAAIMREFNKNGTPLEIQMSVEGKVIRRDNRDPSILRESMIRNIALTLVPANSNTGAKILSEDAKTAILNKCKEAGADMGYANSLMKSLEAEVHPLQHRFIEVNDSSKDPYNRVFQNVQEIRKRIDLVKMLSAGYGTTGQPSARVSGAVLTGEKAGKKLTSTTFEAKDWMKEKKQKILKTLIRKTKEQNLNMSYDDIVEKTLSVFYNKFYKKENK